MGLTDTLRRLMGGDGETEEGPLYECSTCGREYEERRRLCVDCNSRVQEITPA
jgi:uncharacterized OB-fold protein